MDTTAKHMWKDSTANTCGWTPQSSTCGKIPQPIHVDENGPISMEISLAQVLGHLHGPLDLAELLRHDADGR
eukprot:10592202-Alexandrium_andersonii.AAC.1